MADATIPRHIFLEQHVTLLSLCFKRMAEQEQLPTDVASAVTQSLQEVPTPRHNCQNSLHPSGR